MEDMMLNAFKGFGFSECLCLYLLFRMEHTLQELKTVIETLKKEVEEHEGNRHLGAQ